MKRFSMKAVILAGSMDGLTDLLIRRDPRTEIEHFNFPLSLDGRGLG